MNSYYACEVELDCSCCGAKRLVPGYFDNGATFIQDDDVDIVCPVCMVLEGEVEERASLTDLTFYRGLYLVRDGRLVHRSVANAWDADEALAREMPSD